MEKTAGEKGGGGALQGFKAKSERLKGVDIRYKVKECKGENEEGRIMWKSIIYLT